MKWNFRQVIQWLVRLKLVFCMQYQPSKCTCLKFKFWQHLSFGFLSFVSIESFDGSCLEDEYINRPIAELLWLDEREWYADSFDKWEVIAENMSPFLRESTILCFEFIWNSNSSIGSISSSIFGTGDPYKKECKLPIWPFFLFYVFEKFLDKVF